MAFEFKVLLPSDKTYLSTNTQNIIFRVSVSSDVSSFEFFINGVSRVVPASSHNSSQSIAETLVTLEPGVNKLDCRVNIGGWLYLGERVVDYARAVFTSQFEYRPFQLKAEIFQDVTALHWFMIMDALPFVRQFNVYRTYDPTLEESTFIRVATIDAVGFNKVNAEEELDTVKDILEDGTINYIKHVQPVKYLQFTSLVAFERNVTKPAFFAVTAINFDPDNGVLFESYYSDVVKAIPFVIPALTPFIPTSSRKDLATQYMRGLLEKYPEEDLKPGTELQDQIISPLSDFAAKQELKIDFSIRSRMMPAMLEVDDSNGDGESDAVEPGTYKYRLAESFGITPAQVQQVVDAQFEALAGNVFIQRKPSTPSSGICYVYSPSLPSRLVKIPAGALQVNALKTVTGKESDVVLLSREDLVIDPAQGDKYFQPTRNRYEWPVLFETMNSGRNTVCRAETVTSVVSSPGMTLGVINVDPITGGTDRESNSALAKRYFLAYVGNDVGVIYGYLKSILALENVSDGYIVDATHPLMVRDWDEVRYKHIGGMVDVFMRGLELTPVKERFALAPYQWVTMVFNKSGVLEGETFLLKEFPVIGQVLEVVALNRNNSTYHKAGLVLTDSNKIQLDFSAGPNVAIGWAFGERVSVKFEADASCRVFEPSYKPVNSIQAVLQNPDSDTPTDITSSVSLESKSPIWWHGGSYISHDYFVFSTNLPGSIQQKSQSLVIEPGIWTDPLPVVGIDENSIVIMDGSRVVPPVYRKYQYTERGEIRLWVSPAYSLNPFGAVVSYSFYENVEISYLYNELVFRGQQEIYQDRRHIDADVLVKQQVPFSVKIQLRVVLKDYIRRREINQEIRDNLTEYISNLTMGSTLYGSNVIGQVEAVRGVSHVDLEDSQFKVLVVAGQEMPMERKGQPFALHQNSPEVYSTVLDWFPDSSLLESKSRCWGDGQEFSWYDAGALGFTLMPQGHYWIDATTKTLYVTKSLNDRASLYVYCSYILNDPREFVDLQCPATQFFAIASLDIQYDSL